MSEDEKVISLDERRRTGARQRGSARDVASHAPHAPHAPSAVGARDRPTADGAAPSRDPLPGRLVWLYCPTCHSVEYTELELSGGRAHNVCGTVVQEAPVELDLRAEATLADVNLERLEILESLLQGQRRRYEEYRHRLNLTAGRKVEPYAPTPEGGRGLPTDEVDAFGLLVSPFFRDPSTHFPDLAAELGAPPDPAAPPTEQDE